MSPSAGLAEAYLQQSPACHWTVDRTPAFVAVYGDSSQLFRSPAAALIGRPVAEALDAAIARHWLDRVARVFEGETLLLNEHAGNQLWQVSIFPLRVDGAIRYAAGLARETTAWGSAEQELRRTVLGALKAQEVERNRVSTFLHDVVGQNLTALGLQLDLVRMDLETIAPDTCTRIAEIQKVLEIMMEEVREYSY